MSVVSFVSSEQEHHIMSGRHSMAEPEYLTANRLRLTDEHADTLANRLASETLYLTVTETAAGERTETTARLLRTWAETVYALAYVQAVQFPESSDAAVESAVQYMLGNLSFGPEDLLSTEFADEPWLVPELPDVMTDNGFTLLMTSFGARFSSEVLYSIDGEGMTTASSDAAEDNHHVNLDRRERELGDLSNTLEHAIMVDSDRRFIERRRTALLSEIENT